MRTYTLGFSIFIHLLLIGALVISPIVANDVLPEPRRAVEFIEVRPMEPPSIPPPPRGGGQSGTKMSDLRAAPVVVPDVLRAETRFETFEAMDPGTGDPRGVPYGGEGSIATDVPEPPPPPTPKPSTPIRAGGAIHRPQRIRDVAPVYPSIARTARVEGTVILDAVIGEDGRVRNLRVLRSIPLLDQAAIDAVRQWLFTPTLLNGEPVPVVMTVTVTFTLQR